MKVFTLRRVVISVLLAVAGGLLVLAGSMYQEPERLVPNDEAVSFVAPEPNTVIALRQTDIVVQLDLDYTLDAMVINGTAVGGDDIDHVAATNRYTFTAGQGKAITELTEGRNCVTAEFHEAGRSVEQGRTYTWCFQLH